LHLNSSYCITDKHLRFKEWLVANERDETLKHVYIYIYESVVDYSCHLVLSYCDKKKKTATRIKKKLHTEEKSRQGVKKKKVEQE